LIISEKILHQIEQRKDQVIMEWKRKKVLQIEPEKKYKRAKD
jgi:hypothetical protein